MSSIPALQRPSDVPEAAWKNPNLVDYLQNYLDLPILWLLSFTSFVRVVLKHAFYNPKSLFQVEKLKDEAFALTWLFMTKTERDPTIGPLGDIVPMLASAKGVVLELGPGSGGQVRLLTNPDITAIYGVEPCELLHPTLADKVAQVGLSSKYHIVNCGGQPDSLIPALKAKGIFADKKNGDAVFDTIICSKVLCSIPNEVETVEGLYRLLKPGGRILVCEHIRNPWRNAKGSIFARSVQVLFTWLGWSFFLGGCHLDRESLKVLREVAKSDGGWEQDNLDVLVPWGTLPWCFGTLTKRS